MSLYQSNIGKIGEQKAINFLKTNNYSILRHNFRTVFGEIDIIAKKNKTIFFIEVKTRTSLQKGEPWESVKKNKVFHLKKTSQYFLLKYGYKDYKLKLAVISIVLGKNKEELKYFDDLM